MLFNLSKKFGEKKSLDDFIMYSFPNPKKLQSAKESDLLKCGLGYRSKYVLKTARKILEPNSFFDELYQLPYSQAKKRLIQLPGVGPKVADCISFWYEAPNSFLNSLTDSS